MAEMNLPECTVLLGKATVEMLKRLVQDLRTPTPVYLPGDFGNGYEIGRDSANDNTADALEGLLPFLKG